MAACPHCSGQHDPEALFCPITGMAISVSRIGVGTLIDDKYRIIRRVASGGMGAVYEVLHERIQRRMAMKFILPELAANPEVSQRFEIEARAASAIGHENIVEVTDMGTTQDGLPFLVMELLQGFDLAVLLDQGPVTRRRTVHIISQVLAALSAAHERQIIHRDLKPENVFLIQRGDDPDFVKLLDFGISKFAGGEDAKLHLTSTGLILGTPYYMSPEQARGERELDARSDLFSVGVILYQALTGKRPFAANNLNQLLYQITSGKIVPPREVNPDIPLALERVSLKALAHDVEHRFASADEFRDALLGHRQLSTREMPPARVSKGNMKVADAFNPTIAEHSVTDVDPAQTGTPLAWTGGRTQLTSRSPTLWLLVVGVLVIAAGAVFFVFRGRDRPPAPSQPVAPGAATMTALPGGNGPAVMRIQPETIKVTLKVDPADARISLNGRVVTSSPIELLRTERKHRLLVEAKGYEPQALPLSATSDQTLVINLKRREAMAWPGMRRRRPPRPSMEPPLQRPSGMKDIRAITDI
ncbi:MAG: serine/threonine-protein kinase [bacterium]